MNIRCRLGWHDWVEIGTNTLLSDTFYQCRRCKFGRQLVSFGIGDIRYTPEAMREAWAQGKIQNEAAWQKVYLQ